MIPPGGCGGAPGPPLIRTFVDNNEYAMHKIVKPMLVAAGLVAACALSAAEFPQAEISNGQVRAKLYLPDATNGYYQATRFDWSGVIASLEYKNHSYFGVWFPKYDPKLHDSITGPVEEFRTGLSGLGYEEAKVGGTFIRIGVGVLRKPEEKEFQQFRTYDIVDGGKWTVRKAADSIEFTQELAAPSSGYAYLYRKTVRLAAGAPRMTIEHSLTNTGKKVIETNVYNHNFFVIDNQPTGPDFTVRFGFTPVPAAGFRGPGEFRGHDLVFTNASGERGALFGEIGGFGDTSKDFDIRVENRKTKAGVHVTGDQPLWKVVFWSIPTVLSPEAYVNLRVEPGREISWRLTYDFYDVE
jgi:hypothetical protein